MQKTEIKPMKRSFPLSIFVKVITCLTVVIGAVIAHGQSDSPTPAASSRFIFVSPDGSDTNTGFEPDQPVETAERGFELLRNGSPDWLLLKRGHNYTLPQTIFRVSGASENEPLVITSYDQGQAPELHVGPNSNDFEFCLA